MPKERPRNTWGRGNPHTYTPSRTAAAERAIAAFVRQALGPGWEPLSGPIRLRVDVVRKRPAKLPPDQREHGLPTQMPDLKNYLKLIVDALSPRKEGGWGVWDNDKQIVEISARKRYALDGCLGWLVSMEQTGAE